MYTVVYEFVAGKYTVLKLDREIEEHWYSHVCIDGKSYTLIPMYDMPLCIGIEANGCFTGKEVKIE